MKKFLGMIMAVVLGISGVLTFATLTAERVMAWEDPACANMTAEEKEIANCNGTGKDWIGIVRNVLNTVLPTAAVVAVVMIVVAGIMMSVSMGDAGKVKRAKNMIVYALIGLVVALMAWGIVNMVMGLFD